jgi:hypothetical protein
MLFVGAVRELSEAGDSRQKKSPVDDFSVCQNGIFSAKIAP